MQTVVLHHPRPHTRFQMPKEEVVNASHPRLLAVAFEQIEGFVEALLVRKDYLKSFTLFHDNNISKYLNSFIVIININF